MRNSSHRQDINSSRSRHWHKYRKHEKCLSMIKLTCIKQHLSIIWSSIYEKVKQFKLSWKKALLIKKSVYYLISYIRRLPYETWSLDTKQNVKILTIA